MLWFEETPIYFFIHSHHSLVEGSGEGALILLGVGGGVLGLLS